ncbi:MAG: helix-turn-helix transcriptional regulator [Bryobacteraceae bacterium]|nr:helix-turn-helix transcriptional regulator [Bryobacteraceae bacterium]
MDDDSSLVNIAPEITESHFSEDKTAVGRLSDNEAVLGDTKSGETTIRKVLSSYELGPKIRQLRMRKKIALVDLGKHTGLSASMLSQLENGKLVPTLATLARIAMVFDVSLDHFFADRKRRRPFMVVRAEDRIRFPDRPSAPKPDYFFECLAFSTQEKSLQAYMAEFPRRTAEEVTEHYHEGAEFIHVLEGTLIIHYQNEDHSLMMGDSVYFDSAEPHSYRGSGRTSARALVVTTPPRL